MRSGCTLACSDDRYLTFASTTLAAVRARSARSLCNARIATAAVLDSLLVGSFGNLSVF
jgi:hypothetical protein